VSFRELGIKGAFVVEVEWSEDERGSFSTFFRADVFRSRGLEADPAQFAVSLNKRAGSLRGMHYQVAPHEQAKLVWCSAGAIFDVVVDLRPGSASGGKWEAVRLDPAGRQSLYIPRGCAHGFQTLEDRSEVTYLLFSPRVAASERGLRWNDPALAIAWPRPPVALSAKDDKYPDFKAEPSGTTK
jgi:dTDP-4-dehydrorhamnose 3,5-epimerase